MASVSKQYVSKAIKSNSRCKEEKQICKNTNAIKRKDYMKEYISKHFPNLHRKLKSVRKNVRKICIFYKLKPQAYLTNCLRF